MKHSKYLARVVVGAAAITLSGAALVGCGAPAAQAKPSLTWATETEDARLPAEKAVVDSCAAELNIDVKIQQIPSGTYDTKMTTSLRGGTGPDVFRVNHPNVQSWVNAGFLADITSAVSDGTISTSELIPGLVAIGNVGGKQYTLPSDTDARTLFYNPKLLASAGLTDSAGKARPPATWSELVDAVKKFSGDTYGYAFRSDGDYAMAYEAVGPYIKQAQGTVVSNDGTPKAAAADDKGTNAAVQLLQDIVKTGSVPPGENNLSDTTIAQLFAGGKLAMFTGGPWVRAQLLTANSNLKYGVDYATAVIPVQHAGEKSASTSGGFQNGINKKTKNMDASVKFLNCMEKPDNLEKQAVTTAFAPVKGALDKAPFSDDPFYAAFKEVLPQSGLPITPVQQLAQVAAAFESTVLPAVVEGKSVQSQLSAFDDQVNNQILGK